MVKKGKKKKTRALMESAAARWLNIELILLISTHAEGQADFSAFSRAHKATSSTQHQQMGVKRNPSEEEEEERKRWILIKECVKQKATPASESAFVPTTTATCQGSTSTNGPRTLALTFIARHRTKPKTQSNAEFFTHKGETDSAPIYTGQSSNCKLFTLCFHRRNKPLENS